MSESLTGKRILLGVSGSIAAYKAADLASQLVHLGADVHVILTPSAAEFVGATTFRAITLNPVLSGLFDEPHNRKIAHIDLAQSADMIIVAPATANTIAKMALGLADDLLSSALLAATAPILVAPAMNTAMLTHPATQANLAMLKARGVEIIDPVSGVLACRTEGEGKLADPSAIVDAVIGRLCGEVKGRIATDQSVPDLTLSPPHPLTSSDLKGVRVLVTAGATREPLDPVRFISNRSSGKMGFAIAEAAARRGARVILVSGHTTAPFPHGVETVCVNTTEEMLEACAIRFDDCDVLIAAAAPADYAAATLSPQKRKKSGSAWNVKLRETPDIIASLAARKKHHVVVGFAAETEDLLKHAAEKLKQKNLDLIVANDVTAEGAGFEVETNIVTLIWPDGKSESVPKLTKSLVADRLMDAIGDMLDKRKVAKSRNNRHSKTA